jgi:hypothetical protein
VDDVPPKKDIIEIGPEGEDPRNADPLATQKISKAELEAALERAKRPEKRTTSGVRTKAVRPVGEDVSVPVNVNVNVPVPVREERGRAITPRLMIVTLLLGIVLGIFAAYAAGLVG